MKKNIVWVAFGLLFLVSGCSSVYMPNVPNTPMLSTKGELFAGAHLPLNSMPALIPAMPLAITLAFW